MKPSLSLSVIAAVAVTLASCAQPERTVAPSKAHRTGSRFSAAGKVTLHPGQPCASPIMFDFRMTGARSTIWLGAPMRESRVLTDAANRNRRVRIWGSWQGGKDRSCDYVSVTKVEPLSIAVVF